MGTSNVGVTDDGSATISDEEDATTEIDIDVDSESSSPIGTSPFAEGDKVLAYHNRRLYEAKVLKVDYKRKEWRFRVHYLGWNKSWDEWITVDRLMKYTEKNIQKQLDLNKMLGTEELTKPGRASLIKPKNPHVARGKKRKTELKLGAPFEKLIDVQIPPMLKKQLVDYCEYITHLGKLVKLPRTPNVDDILNKYLEYRTKKDGRIAESVTEILHGLRCYFDKALPAMLLCKSERQQYQDAISDGASPSTVYGAEHLLRLFVKLPEILYFANIEEVTLIELQHKLHDLLKFLQKNQSAFFVSLYQTPDSFLTTSEKDP